MNTIAATHPAATGEGGAACGCRGRRRTTILGLFAAATTAFLGACADPPASRDAAAPASRPDSAETMPFVLQSSDALDVKFFYHPELNESVVVRPDGQISLQLIGEIMAAGLTPKELEAAIVERYANVLLKPEVTVVVRGLASRTFYIFGEVNQPGNYPFENGMIMLNAVAKAGGFTYRAQVDRMKVISANDPTKTPRLVERNARVFPGDVIEVSERYF
jgi:polysaccharide export outer membrane protein